MRRACCRIDCDSNYFMFNTDRKIKIKITPLQGYILHHTTCQNPFTYLPICTLKNVLPENRLVIAELIKFFNIFCICIHSCRLSDNIIHVLHLRHIHDYS